MEFSKGRILYAEDHPDSRELVVMLLRGEGYQVTAVEDPTEFLPLAQTEHFDLFLVDNWMPSMNGAQLTRRLREFNTTTPILFYSAAAYEKDIQEALNAGAQAYLVKPNDAEMLLSEVARLIAESTNREPKKLIVDRLKVGETDK